MANSILKAILGKNAPTHYAETYRVRHDGTYNLVEARRGRGKTYGGVNVGFEWLLTRMPEMLAGTAPYAKWATNIKIHRKRLAYELCFTGAIPSLFDALDFVQDRYLFLSNWDDYLTLFDSLVIGDEWNRNVNTYEADKEAQRIMLVVHDHAQQTRKSRLTQYFLFQHADWIKSQIRVLGDRLWRARVVYTKPKALRKPDYFWWYGGDAFANGQGSEITRRADFKMRVPFILRRAQLYDTEQAVETFAKMSRFSTYGEIADYLESRGIKRPTSFDEKSQEAPTLLELDEIFRSVDERLRASSGEARATPVSPSPPVGGGETGTARALLDRYGCPISDEPRSPLIASTLSQLPPAFDPASIAPGFPSDLL